MASSNRHWPSMFKSKPCNSHHHQWQHDIISACQKQPYSSGGEERSPEPKPRWNPKPEQIRILEAIFNSGMVNPPRDEIRKIRAQLQEYGQVGDANVFYWFQNRKSRSKHKQRHLSGKSHISTITSTSVAATPPTQMTMVATTASATAATATATTTTTNSSSSSERTSSSAYLNGMESVNSPSTANASVNQASFYQPALHQFPLQDPRPSFVQNGSPFPSLASASSLSELSSMVQLHEQLKQDERLNVVGGGPHQNYAIAPILQDFADSASGSARLTVFINDLAFEVAPVPVNIREAFGEEAVLLHSSGQPVMTDEFGFTLQPLQNGAFYYLV
ncbi:unnamed protein product [Victoria cruziana]